MCSARGRWPGSRSRRSERIYEDAAQFIPWRPSGKWTPTPLPRLGIFSALLPLPRLGHLLSGLRAVLLPLHRLADLLSGRQGQAAKGFPHDPMRRYICTVGLDRRTLFPTTFYQVRRDARWGWLLVTAHAIKACFRLPVRHSSGGDAIEAAQFFSASEATLLMNAARIANEDAAAGLWQCPVCTFGGNASQASCCEVCTSSRQ